LAHCTKGRKQKEKPKRKIQEVRGEGKAASS